MSSLIDYEHDNEHEHEKASQSIESGGSGRFVPRMRGLAASRYTYAILGA